MSKKKLKRKNKKLQHKVWKLKRAIKSYDRDLAMFRELSNELEIENERLKQPVMQVWINGEQVESVAK